VDAHFADTAAENLAPGVSGTDRCYEPDGSEFGRCDSASGRDRAVAFASSDHDFVIVCCERNKLKD
jgi:hypothetical protein